MGLEERYAKLRPLLAQNLNSRDVVNIYCIYYDSPSHLLPYMVGGACQSKTSIYAPAPLESNECSV